MDKNQKKLKEMLRNLLPLLEEFVGDGTVEEEPFGRSDQEVEIDFQNDGYSEDIELDEAELEEEADKELDDVIEDDKEMRKKISAATISRKLGKDKKRK